jgi:hypothetical protein
VEKDNKDSMKDAITRALQEAQVGSLLAVGVGWWGKNG